MHASQLFFRLGGLVSGYIAVSVCGRLVCASVVLRFAGGFLDETGVFLDKMMFCFGMNAKKMYICRVFYFIKVE